MPDFFDRLIARGMQQPGGRMPSSGQPAHEAGRASEPSSGATVTFALPRLPGPFERPATEPTGAFLEAVDEVRELDAQPPETARARPSRGGPAGTRAVITPPPLLRGSTVSLAPGSARTGRGQQLPASMAPAGQAPLLPSATPVYLVPEAGAAALDQVSAGVGRPAADGRHEPDAAASAASRPERPIPQPSPTRTLAVPANVVRAARPAADDARAARAQPPAPPPVVVRIGRIEVRNPSLDRRERQPKRRAARAAPRQTLAAYLAAASDGRNGNGVWQGGGR
jgi:hypothetical protein